MTTELERFAAAANNACLALEMHDDLLTHVLLKPGLVQRVGTWCEFGVYEGGSLRRIATQRGAATLWGFDSCRGLPEQWNDKHPVGRFAVPQPPMPDDGVNLVVGWYADTVPAFAPPQPVTFMHMDCDLYASARCVLKHLQPHLAMGAVIVFDEIFAEPFERGEMRALQEAASEDHLSFEWIASHRDQGAIRVGMRQKADS